MANKIILIVLAIRHNNNPCLIFAILLASTAAPSRYGNGIGKTIIKKINDLLCRNK